MNQYSVEDMMKAYSEDAIDLGKQFGVHLDFSEESIKEIENILEKYHSSLPKGFMSRLLNEKGNAEDARNFFENQVDADSIKEVKPGVFIGTDKSNGVTFTYRPVSKSGPPTIDINGIKGLRKIKYLL